VIDVVPESIPVFSELPGIRAFFTTRNGGYSRDAYGSLNLSFFTGDDSESVRRNWGSLLKAQGLTRHSLALPRLSHGIHIEEISGLGGHSGGIVSAAPADTDALFTRSSEWVLAVTMGDCLAALIADPVTRCVAAVHAGWRGSRDNILGRTLERLFSQGHCRPDSTWVALGPCLSPGAMGVSKETADTLPSQYIKMQDGSHFFDLTGCNRAQAEASGARHFVEIGGCTRTDAQRFFSYRRDGAKSGRMAACIALV